MVRRYFDALITPPCIPPLLAVTKSDSQRVSTSKEYVQNPAERKRERETERETRDSDRERYPQRLPEYKIFRLHEIPSLGDANHTMHATMSDLAQQPCDKIGRRDL